MTIRGTKAFPLFASLLVFGAANAQLRIANWNVTNYTSGRIAAFQTSFYGIFEGRQFAPDIVIGQEFLSQTAVNNFLAILNSAPGTPGDWAAAPFIDGADTDGGFFYRTSKVQYLGTTIVAVGSSSTSNQPRNTYRYDVRPTGYTGATATLALYSSHMKAGSTSEDMARRLVEAKNIRTNAESLPVGWGFLLGGDFNIQSSSQTAYQWLIESQANNNGRLFDPIKTPGSWDNNSSYRFVHTQDPASTAGMDSRYDQLLLSGSLIDGSGCDYIGNPNLAYSTTTWDDPNHSHRAWGNDGTSFNAPLTVAGNTFVGPTIAQALVDSANGQGHLPVYVDMRVPAKIGVSTLTIDFGFVDQFSTAQRPVTVTNVGNTTLWSTGGLASLKYSFPMVGGFTVPSGTQSEAPGGGGNTHQIGMNTSTAGYKQGTLTILSDDPDNPVVTIVLRGWVVGRLPHKPPRKFF